MSDDVIKEIDACAEALSTASQHGLEPEVVLFALKAMKKNPSLSIEGALAAGLSEWDL